MKQQTAVNWLIDQLKDKDFSIDNDKYEIEINTLDLDEMCRKAKEMEKQQIEDAWIHGAIRNPKDLKHINNPQTYFKEKF